MQILIAPNVTIDADELQFRFVRASGPGGQNVNKVATAVQLRFDAAHCSSLSDPVRRRLMRLAGKRLTAEGEIVIEARRHRTQEQNRQDAIDRLVALIRQALVAPKTRRKTRPTLASRERRLAAKQRRGRIKQNRGSIDADQ
ncbi:MAG: alternative ribosome rescue aminoacyl-tRNA hydrolase ArfB [Desulfobacterales bacterium]|jgi:ribosome-associated protein|nr:alternative ribosome rescue aminoacyl-tRNA hydrolase ArfB [Desulfobacteraceae bacterium]MDD3991911.1 alternative ribosome rescue aminoacyl-tRNA hydrolase ArfB [Desulfobacteraceae bacterium]MDY0312574.1 alternative ribosome rescue aminoacyl-tRNA hydrolase ArfB [Desulfobacterales bacterium]